MADKNPLVDKLRLKLLPKVKLLANGTAEWPVVDLTIPGGRMASVEVCPPLAVTVTADDMKGFESLIPARHSGSLPPLYVPVTKLETWEMAKDFKAFPLSRKVMDRIYKSGKFPRVPFSMKEPFQAGAATDNFVAYSIYLESQGAKPNQLFSGALKLWILSNERSGEGPNCHPPNYSQEDPSVNYGMYDPNHAKGRWQPIRSCHNQYHSDYSQLLQYMRKLRINGHEFDMGAALATAHPAVWDEVLPNKLEPYRLTGSDKSYLPFVTPLASSSTSAASHLAGTWTVKYFKDEEIYRFDGNQVRWSNTRGESGKGYWTERNNQIIISWSKSGSVEIWPASGTKISTTLNFVYGGTASKN